MLGFGGVGLAAFSLSPRRQPAVDLSQAFRVLAVALVPTSRVVLATAFFVKAGSLARATRSGFGTAFFFNVVVAHGRFDLPRESSGRMRVAFSSGVIKTRTRRLLASLSSSREQDREINGLIGAAGTRTPSAAHQTIIFSRTRPRDKRSHRRAGNKNPERCSPNDRKRCRIRDRSHDFALAAFFLFWTPAIVTWGYGEKSGIGEEAKTGTGRHSDDLGKLGDM